VEVNMSFWDSQILGVIVGGFIGGFGKLYHEIRSENRLKTNLERGIKSEIKILKNFAESSHQILNAYFEALNRDGKVKITYKIKGASFLSFANPWRSGKLTLLCSAKLTHPKINRFSA